MRVVFFIDNEGGQVGGGDFCMFKFAQALARRGHPVDVFAKSPPHAALSAPTLRIHHRPRIARAFRGSGALDSALESWAWRTAILPRLRRHRPSIVCGVLHRAAIRAVEAARALGVPAANFYFETPPWLADMGEWQQIEAQPRFRKYRALWASARQAYLASDCLIGNSALAKHYCDLWLGRPTDGVVYPGIDLAEVGEIGPWPRSRQIMYVGRLHRTKNADTAIESLGRMKDPPTLLVAGSGPEHAVLERRARALRVPARFLGVIGEPEKFRLLKESQLLVFPSSVEGFGMPPMEALACGTPALCSDIPVLRSVYGDHVEYAPARDVDTWTLMLRSLLHDQGRLAELGRRGREYVAHTFSWTRGAAQIEGMLHACIEKHKRKCTPAPA